MNNRIVSSLVMAVIAGSGLVSTLAFAQTSDDAATTHPRVNEVTQRLENQQKRVDAGVKDGQINATQAAHDEKRIDNVNNQLTKDEAKNGGHITKAEQKKMNRELNNNSKHIKHQRANAKKSADKTTN